MRGVVWEVLNFEAPPDAWEYRPIANAEILVLWYGYRSSFVHGHSVCLKKVYTKSGTDGRFHVPGWKAKPPMSGIKNISPVSYAFVPGWESVPLQIRRDHIWQPGPGVHVMRRVPDDGFITTREQAFVNAQFCAEALDRT